MLYSVENICKNFTLNGDTITVLKDLSFTVEEGKWVALIGPSGSGKTTLLQLLGGLDRPMSGSIFIHGTDITRLSKNKLTTLRHKSIGFVFQSYHLFPELTALENVALPALGWFDNRQKSIEKAKDYLTDFGLGDRMGHLPQELSGGEQQRVAIARALINKPEIILADEPTGNLDAKSTQQIVDILNRIRVEEHKTIIMVTHDLALAEKADITIPLPKRR
ncbi:MAG: ABC transporter ATP-binding protein [Victivallales bacterium]|nr:ABC transporter ATP-binding protein [Victivallales bacterium]